MATGLFSYRQSEGGPRKGYVPKNRRKPSLDRFADALAESGSVSIAAERVGVSRTYGNALLQRIRKDLGWQAR